MVSYINKKDSITGMMDFNEEIDVKKMMIVVIIEIILLLLIQRIWGSITIKEITLSIGILIIGYYMPLACKWHIKIEEIIHKIRDKAEKERYFCSYKYQIETRDAWILDIRYIMLVILWVLICFLIINMIIQLASINNKRIKLIVNLVGISICLVLSYTYLQVQRDRRQCKDELDVTLTMTVNSLESLRLSDIKSQIPFYTRDILNSIFVEDTARNINETIPMIWNMISETANDSNFFEQPESVERLQKKLSTLAKKQPNITGAQLEIINTLLEIEKDDSFFEQEEKVEEFKEKLRLISQSYIEFTINERLKNYLGIYIPSDFEERYSEWFLEYAKLITDYNTMDK